MNKSRKFLAAAGTVLGLILSVPVQAELAIIANPDSKAIGTTTDELAKVYLARSRTISGGVKVEPMDQEPGSASREKFYSDVIQKSESELKRYWSKRMFTGKGKPPRTVLDDEAMKEWVAKNRDAIGYIDGALLDGSVKVLLILP